MFKNNDVTTMLYNLIKLYFEYGKIPSVLLKSIISHIPKSSNKDPHVPLNYRGISLLSCVGKAYSSLLNRHIVSYCAQMDVFNNEQNRFRQDRSCADHICSLTSVLRNILADKQHTFSYFIEMQKAFDWVHRDLLFYKLLQNNIDDHNCYAVKSLYSNPTACVKLNKIHTDWFETKRGVKQGDPLSLTLFCIFINDLITEINNLNIGISIGSRKLSILSFADDIVLIVDSEEKLQAMVNHVELWCNKWRLCVNNDKTKIMHFRNRRKAKCNTKFMFGASEQEIVKQYKYLGVF